jgi:hypothetical protein
MIKNCLVLCEQSSEKPNLLSWLQLQESLPGVAKGISSKCETAPFIGRRALVE